MALTVGFGPLTGIPVALSIITSHLLTAALQAVIRARRIAEPEIPA